MRFNRVKMTVVIMGVVLICINLGFAENETIKRTLKFSDPTKTKKVIVDNIWGSIDVIGYSGKDVQLVAYKTIKGETKRAKERAKEEVELEITEHHNEIELYVDAPFRDEERNGFNRDGGMWNLHLRGCWVEGLACCLLTYAFRTC